MQEHKVRENQRMKCFLGKGIEKKRLISCMVVLAALALLILYAKGLDTVKKQYHQDFDSLKGKNAREASFTIENLKTDRIDNAVGVDETTPSFSWEIVSKEPGFKQKAYRICVWDVTDVDNSFTDGEGYFAPGSDEARKMERSAAQSAGKLVWDSDTVFSDKTINISYCGEALQSHRKYQWQVVVWSAQEEAAASQKTSFVTAYVGEQPFAHAQMISMEGEENVYDDGQAVFVRDFQVDPQKQLKRATLYASALGIYDAWMNGERVGDDELKPGWSNYNKSLYYNTYDITNLLHTGIREATNAGGTAGQVGVEGTRTDSREDNQEEAHADSREGNLEETHADSREDNLEEARTDSREDTQEEAHADSREDTQGAAHVDSQVDTQKDNRIAVMLGTGWWCGRVSFGTYDYHKPGFICTIRLEYTDGSVEEIHTDESWKYIKDTAVVSADIFNGEVYDGNKPTTQQLSQPQNPEEATRKQVVISEDFKGTFRSFYGYPVKHVKAYDRKPEEFVRYDSVSDNGTKYGEIVVKEQKPFEQNLFIEKGETVIFDMGQNMTGVPWIKYQAQKGTTITLDFAEMLNDSGAKKRGNDGPLGSLYTANYRSAASELTLVAGEAEVEEYQPVFTYYGFRYLSVTATEDIVLCDITGKFIGNSSPETGFIQTDQDLVNRLYENVAWTRRNNFLLVATDCPQRDERIGWTGDLQVFARTSMYDQDLASFYRKWFQDVKDSQTEEGAYTDTVPATITTGAGNAGWGDAGISIPHDYYQMYGDSKQLGTSYPSMKQYMDYLAGISNFDMEQGRIGPLTSFGDWLGIEDSDKECISTLYYAKDAAQMAETARILEKKKDAEDYEKLSKKIKTYFSGKYMSDGEIKEEYRTQTVLVLAIAYDMLSPEEAETALEQLSKKIKETGGTLSTGFLGTPVILKVLSENGRLAEAYQLLLQDKNPSWMYSILQGATTVWERYDSYTLENGFADAAMNSFNHFNNGSVVQWMYEDMLGIQMVQQEDCEVLLSPGILLDNEKATVHYVEGSYHSVYGEIKACFQITEEQVVYQVELPANCRANLQLPVYDRNTKETVEGTKNIWETDSHIPSDDTEENGKQTGLEGTAKQIYAQWVLDSGSFRFVYDRQQNRWTIALPPSGT